ncbi:MAG: hypothetical protein HY089_10140 [Ignavibacteriales bacterium]|nr:hypothetical protein [Ignavibacteriales bacterium]
MHNVGNINNSSNVLIVVEVNVVLHRAGVVGSHDLHSLSGQTLVLFELAHVNLEPSNTHKLI